jgi:hypothetical protein
MERKKLNIINNQIIKYHIEGTLYIILCYYYDYYYFLHSTLYFLVKEKKCNVPGGTADGTTQGTCKVTEFCDVDGQCRKSNND